MNTIERAMARADAMRASWAGDTAVTPKGAVVATINRLSRQLAALDPADRATVRPLLDELVADQCEAGWCDFGAALASRKG